MNLVRSEWIKLRTVRVTLVLAIVAAALPIVVVVLVASLGKKVEDVSGSDLTGLITGTMVVTALLFGVIGALNLTSEYSHGTIRTTFAAVPRRWHVLLVKGGVALAATLASAIVILLTSLVIGRIILSSRDAHLTFSGDSKAGMVGIVIFCGLLSLFGFGLGLIIRNSAAAITLFVLWPLLLENIASLVLSAAGVDDPQRWLPYQSAFKMILAEPQFGGSSRLHGGVYFGAVALALVFIGIVINERRDA